MWKDFIRNIVVIFQPNILRIVGFYVRHSADVVKFAIVLVTYVKHLLLVIKSKIFTSKKNFGIDSMIQWKILSSWQLKGSEFIWNSRILFPD